MLPYTLPFLAPCKRLAAALAYLAWQMFFLNTSGHDDLPAQRNSLSRHVSLYVKTQLLDLFDA